MPEISVVIPLYNKGPYVSRVLRSVLNQTFQDFEVIVVDDGSTDNGADVVKGFIDPRIKLIQQANQGVSSARNRGAEIAEVELIAFLDADDEWSNTHLETLYKLCCKYPECGLFATSFIRVINGKKGYKRKLPSIPEAPWDGVVANYFFIQRVTQLINSSNVAIKKDALFSIGGFPIGMKQYEDLVVWDRIALKYNIAFSYNGEAYIHKVNESASCQLLRVKEHPFIIYGREALDDKELSSQIKKELQKYISTLYVRIACRNITCKNFTYTLTNLRSSGWSILRPKNLYLIFYTLLKLVWPR